MTRRKTRPAINVMDPTRKIRVGFYGRVSINKKGASRSVPEQLRHYEKMVAKHGHWSEVDRYSDDNRSASPYRTRIRSDYDRLCADIVAGRLDLLWVWEISRSNRDLEEFAPLRKLCRDYGVQVYVHAKRRVYNMDDPSDGNDLAKDAVAAEGESIVISRRVSEVAAAAVEDGNPWGWLKYGYAREYDPYTRKLVAQVEHHTRGKLVTEIATRYAAGEGVLAIARDLTARGVETPGDAQFNDANPGAARRSKWTEVAITRIARSPVYIGQRVYRGGQALDPVHDGNWPALVDVDTHTACVARYQSGQRPGTSTIAHLLTGPCTCLTCGQPVCVRNLKTGLRYRCDAGHASAPVVLVDAYVVGSLLTWAARKDVARLLQLDTTPAAKALRAEIAKQEQAKEGWWEQRHTLGPERVAQAVAECDAQIKALRARMTQVSVPRSLRNLLAQGPKGVALAWDSMSLAAQRATIYDLMAVQLRPGGRGNRSWVASQRVNIEWRMSIND